MEAQQSDTPQWSIKKVLRTQAFALSMVLVLFIGAYFLSSTEDVLTQGTVFNRLVSRQGAPRRFGEFSANGQRYRSVSALSAKAGVNGDALEEKSLVRRAAQKRPRSAGGAQHLPLKKPEQTETRMGQKTDGQRSKELTEQKGGLEKRALGQKDNETVRKELSGDAGSDASEAFEKLESTDIEVGKTPQTAMRNQANSKLVDQQTVFSLARSQSHPEVLLQVLGTSIDGSYTLKVEQGKIVSVRSLGPGQKLEDSSSISEQGTNATTNQIETPAQGLVTNVQLSNSELQHSQESISRQVSGVQGSAVQELQRSKSTAECVRDADGSDVCHYGGAVCYDRGREKLVLIDDDRKGQAFTSEVAFQDGRWTHGRLPPESKWPLPVNNKVEGVWGARGDLLNATFLDGALWIVRPETDNTNHIWHNGLSFTGLLQGQMRNASGAFPPQDYVLVLNRTASDAGYTDYNMGMLRIVSQPHTKLLFRKHLPQDDRLLCSTRGAITSYKPPWSTGPLDAAELRARAYEHLKVPPVSKANWTRVTVVNRPPRFPRHVENVEEVTKMVKGLGLEVNLVQEIPGQARSFREQVLTMSQTGILIAPHGGGLANLAWLPENAVVIELFPNKCVQTEYRNMAAVRNLIYFGVEAVNYTYPQALAEYSSEEVARCQGLRSIDHSHDGTCNQMIKNYPFKVPLKELERTIRYALEHFFTLEVPFPLQKRL